MTRLPAWTRTTALVVLAATIGVAVGIRIAPMPDPVIVLTCPAPVKA